MENAPFTLKVGMQKADVMEALLDGCVTWALGQEHFAELRMAHHKLLMRTIGSQHRQRTDHLMSYTQPFKKTQRESVETTIRKRCLLFCGGRAVDDQLTDDRPSDVWDDRWWEEPRARPTRK